MIGVRVVIQNFYYFVWENVRWMMPQIFISLFLNEYEIIQIIDIIEIDLDKFRYLMTISNPSPS